MSRRKSHALPGSDYDSPKSVDSDNGHITIARRKSHAVHDSDYASLHSADSEKGNVPTARRKSHAAKDSDYDPISNADFEKGNTTVARRKSHSARDSDHDSVKSAADSEKDGSGSSIYGYVPELSHNYAYYDRSSATSSFGEVYSETDYLVEEINKHDDAELLSPWRRRVHRLAPLCTLAAVAAYFTYYAFRICFTVNAQRKYGKTYGMAWVFITTEFMVALPTIAHQVYSLLAMKQRKRPQLRIIGDAVPTVDVFITCCKEEVDIIIDTARAACDIDYPQERFRVVVLDDGADPALEKAMENLNHQYSNALYFARTKVKGKPHHAKAGNLIGGTAFVEKLPGGAGEYIAALDADMIPERQWLRALIPHCVRNPNLALACPPQLFHNVPDDDLLVQSLDPFVHVMEPIKDACGVAWCTGSGYVIRRSALEAGQRLLGRGYETAYVHEGLQYGTVPNSYTGHLKQRTRWTLGTLQSALQQRFCLYGDICRDMTVYQRLSGFVFTMDAFFKLFLVISILTIPIVLISGGTLVAYSTNGELRWQIRLAFISFLLLRLQEYLNSLPSGYRLALRDSGSMLWMAPYHAKTVLVSFLLPKWLGGRSMAFTTTGSLKDDINERDGVRRAHVFRRLKVILWDCSAYQHLFYILFVIAAVTLSTVRAFVDNQTAKKKLIYLLTHAFFPPMLWLVCCTAFATPIRYALFPPTMPHREELLDRNLKTGVAHPKEHWKTQRWSKSHWRHELEIIILVAYSISAFIITFTIPDDKLS